MRKISLILLALMAVVGLSIEIDLRILLIGLGNEKGLKEFVSDLRDILEDKMEDLPGINGTIETSEEFEIIGRMKKKIDFRWSSEEELLKKLKDLVVDLVEEKKVYEDYDYIFFVRKNQENYSIFGINLFDPEVRFFRNVSGDLEESVMDILVNDIYYPAKIVDKKAVLIDPFGGVNFFKVRIYSEEGVEGEREFKERDVEKSSPNSDYAVLKLNGDVWKIFYKPLNAFSINSRSLDFPTHTMCVHVYTNKIGRFSIENMSSETFRARLYNSDGSQLGDTIIVNAGKKISRYFDEFGVRNNEHVVLAIYNEWISNPLKSSKGVRFYHLKAKTCEENPELLPKKTLQIDLREPEISFIIRGLKLSEGYIDIGGKLVSSTSGRLKFSFRNSNLEKGKYNGRFIVRTEDGKCFFKRVVINVMRSIKLKTKGISGRFSMCDFEDPYYVFCYRSKPVYASRHRTGAAIYGIHSEIDRPILTNLETSGVKVFRTKNASEVYTFYSDNLSGGMSAVTVLGKSRHRILFDGKIEEYCSNGRKLLALYSKRSEKILALWDVKNEKKLFESEENDTTYLSCENGFWFASNGELCEIRENNFLFMTNYETKCRRIGSYPIEYFKVFEDGSKLVIFYEGNMTNTVKYLGSDWGVNNVWVFYGSLKKVLVDDEYIYLFSNNSIGVIPFPSGNLRNFDLGSSMEFEDAFKISEGTVYAIYKDMGRFRIYRISYGSIDAKSSFIEGKYVKGFVCGGKPILIFKKEEGLVCLENVGLSRQ